MRKQTPAGLALPCAALVFALSLVACMKNSAPVGENATDASPPLPSPFINGKVQLDYPDMLENDATFAAANPGLKSGTVSLTDHASIVLPAGTRLTTLLKNDCAFAQKASNGVLSAAFLPTEQNEDLDVQAYSTSVPAKTTVAEVSKEAEADPCVVGVANEVTVSLEPVIAEETETFPADSVSPTNVDESAQVSAHGLSDDPRLTYQSFLKTIEASTAYDLLFSSSKGISEKVVIAIVDSGVNYRHQDLAANMWTSASGYFGYDFVNYDSYPWDDRGHGTHVAGLAAARRDNGVGITGVAGWCTRIMAVKVLNSRGEGTSTAAINGIRYATRNGANVINLSIGGYGANSALYDAIADAVNSGVTVVAAAGNSGRRLSSSNYFRPASYAKGISGMISVGSIDSVSHYRSSFSNYSSSGYVEIGAPGSNGMLSTLMSGGYGYMSGTSMASPVTAGAAALAIAMLKSRGYYTYPSRIEALIRDSGSYHSHLTSYFTGGKHLNLENMAQLINSRYPEY